jgi:cell pole-organizing protein PopZ
MSKDSSGESLEAILASIRRSLAEQATSVLQEEAVAPPELLPRAGGSTDLDAPPIPASLSQALAGVSDAAQAAGKADPPIAAVAPAPAGTPAAAPRPMAAQDPVVDPAPPVPATPAGASVRADPTAAAGGQVPAVGPVAGPLVERASTEAPIVAPAGEPAPGQKDPLWFLSQGPGPPPEPKPARAPEPKPSRLGSVRGPLAPFFGSTAEEVVKVEMVPDPPLRSRKDAMPPPASPLPSLASAQAFEGPHAVSGDAPRAVDAAGVARTSSIFGPAPAEARTAGAGETLSQIQALEAMVADLLRPMLRRWLDENMPRLVSAALKAEAELMSRRDPGRDPKKP